MDPIDEEPSEFEWNIFQGFTALQLVHEVQKFMSKMGEPEQFQGRIVFKLSSCRCSMTSYGEIKTIKRDVLLIPHLCLCSQKDFQQDVGHSSDLGQRQSGISLTKRPGGEWDRVAELMMFKFRESGQPIFRATSPLSRGTLKSKGGGNYLYTSVPMVIRLKLIFAQLFL